MSPYSVPNIMLSVEGSRSNPHLPPVHFLFIRNPEQIVCLQFSAYDSVLREMLLGKHISNLRCTDDTSVMPESEELKSLLMRVKEESIKASLKFNISKTKIMVFSPITSWQLEGEKVEVVMDFFSSWTLKSLQMVTVAMKLEDNCFLAGKL